MTNLFLLTILSGILIGLVDLLLKVISRQTYSAQTQLCLISAVGALFSFPAFLFRPTVPLETAPWMWMVLTVISYVIANTCLLNAYKLEDVSNVSLVTRISVPLSFLAGVVLFGETHNPAKLLGLVAIFIGIIIVFFEKRISSATGLLYALTTGVLYTAAVIGSKYSLNYFDPYSYIFFPYLGVTLVSFFLPKVKKELRGAFMASKYEIIITEVLAVVGYLIYIVSIKNLSLSVGNTVYESLGVIVPVGLGIIILNERKRLIYKLAGSALVITGVVLMGV